MLGLQKLEKRLAEFSLDKDDFIIGIESTEDFSENFYEYLTDSGYKVILLNSYQTAKFRNFSTMKKIKNDAIDALVIAELLATGKYKESHISNDAYHSVKVLGRLKVSRGKSLLLWQRLILKLLKFFLIFLPKQD